MFLKLILPVIFIAGLSSSASATDTDASSLRPGLVAKYHSLVDAKATLSRIDLKPAFTLGFSSPNPRLPGGQFEVTWTGMIVLTDAGPIIFSAFVCGEIHIEIDGVTALAGRGLSETSRIESDQPLARQPGIYRIKARFRSIADSPARLQIHWQSTTFSRETLPAWVLKHVDTHESAELKTDRAAETGRLAVERYGCAKCHASAFPAAAAPPQGPSLADVGRRISKAWLREWLADPAKLRAGAHMPALFSSDRDGFVERWLIAEHLLGTVAPRHEESKGDHRPGRVQFISVGCAACHFLPDLPRTDQLDLGRTPLMGLADRLPGAELAAFLRNPHARYPHGQMPQIPLTQQVSRDIAAYLLLWSNSTPLPPADTPPTDAEIKAVAKRLGSNDVGAALIRAKRCAECHPGLGPGVPSNVPIHIPDNRRGCLSGKTLPRFEIDQPSRDAIAAYRGTAARDKHPSPFADRQRQLDRAGCVRCHQRDSDLLSPLELSATTLGGSGLETVPFQRAPRLTDPHQKFTHSHMLSSVRDGVQGLRAPRYTYRMPAYGPLADGLVQALAEGDGELVAGSEPAERSPVDPTIGSLHGPTLIGSTGYACVSCHVWNGRMLADQDPGSTGPDLTRVHGRIRREWFDRYLEGPARAHPGTPMPAIFPKGQPPSMRSILDGNAAKQREALWAYLSLGKQAPSPKAPPPLPIVAPANGPLIAQVPIRLPNGSTIEGIAMLYANGDLIDYDVGHGAVHSVHVGAQILRTVQGRLRFNSIRSNSVLEFGADLPLLLINNGKPETPKSNSFIAYERTDSGVQIRRQVEFTSAVIGLTESFDIGFPGFDRKLLHGVKISGIPLGQTIEWRTKSRDSDAFAIIGRAQNSTEDGVFRVNVTGNEHGNSQFTITHQLPKHQSPPALEPVAQFDPRPVAGSLERPGYRAIAYPRPKTVNGDDLVMPGALAINPKDGRVFVASMKSGAIYVLRDPHDNGVNARFDDYAGGMFQDCLAMRAEPNELLVMHRRSLTRISDEDSAGRARKFERIAALTQGVSSESYDYAYGLVRDRAGGLVYTYAPYANTKMSGAGGALRFVPGKPPEEIAYGFRNPLGWCAGTDGEIFFTDNQGEWVATNKLCHLTPGRFFGFPNSSQPQHTTKPAGKAAVWIPYQWAHSINGVACDTTEGKFGPFAGQFFLAELVFGGGIIRANLEKVNGEYQGACFPFWGQGLLGPLTLGFDLKGRLFVGSITEPGWMAQPDRGALFRIDFTGDVPFEMKSVHIRPNGFQVVFTRPITSQSALAPGAFRMMSHRYEYTGAYGSPEFDRAPVEIKHVEMAPDRLSVELTTAPLIKDRVYLIQAGGIRSPAAESLVNPIAAYTVNEIPAR